MKPRQITRFVLFVSLLAACLAGGWLFSPRSVAGQEARPAPLQGAAALDRLKRDGHYDSLQEAMRQARFSVSRAHSTPLGRWAWQAPNPAAGYDAYVTETGVSIALADDSLVSLSLRGVGYGKALRYIAPGEVSGDQQTIRVQRDGGVQEWYINGESGLEQGFTLSEPPPGGRWENVPLRLTLEVSEGWRAVASEDGQLVTLLGEREQAVEYSKLAVHDSLGRPLLAWFTVEDQQVVIEVNDSEATYPLTIDPTFTQQAKLKAADAAAGDQLGNAVALDGNTAAVGARFDDVTGADQGSVYVFVRNGGVWTQQARLNAVDGAAGDQFGNALALSGNTILVAAVSDDNGAQANQGSVYVFERSGTIWTQQQKLLAADGAANDLFGSAVALNGATAIVGAFGDNVSRGSAYVFVRNGAVWTQQQRFGANDGAPGEQFGVAVAIDGDTALVGADRDGGSLTARFIRGAAYVFTRNGATWTQQQKLVAGDAAASKQFGISVALSGETAVVGAFPADPPVIGPVIGPVASRFRPNVMEGGAYVFVRSGATWTQQQKLMPSDGAPDDLFGRWVALSGDIVVVGADGNNTGTNDNQGAAYVFARNGATWTQQRKLLAADGKAGDRFGIAVALSGDTVLVGAFGADGTSNNQGDQGAAYVFVLCNNNYNFRQRLTASDGAPNDLFGDAIALDGDTLVVGAPDLFRVAKGPGSAYVFVRNGAVWTQQQKLVANDGAAGDNFGISVAISGSTVVVGAWMDQIGANLNQGSAYVFVRNGLFWTQQQKLTASDGAMNDFFGRSVALSGDTAMVGTVGPSSHAVYVFVRNRIGWTLQQKLTSAAAVSHDSFGLAVALSGDTALVGAPSADIGANRFQGSAYVFVRSGATWTFQQKLTASDGASGDGFGRAVALSGDTVLVGVPNDDASAQGNQGSAYVFVRHGVLWTQQQKLTGGDFDSFGTAVALSGDTAVVGAPGIDNSLRPGGGSLSNIEGFAYVFTRSGTAWAPQQELTAAGGVSDKYFGGAVALSGDTLLVGASKDDISGNFNQGAVHYFNCPPCPTFAFTPTSLPNGVVGATYNQAITVTTGGLIVAAQFSVSGGALPPGLTLAQNGLLSGVPAAAGTQRFTLTATIPGSLCSGSHSYTLTIAP